MSRLAAGVNANPHFPFPSVRPNFVFPLATVRRGSPPQSLAAALCFLTHVPLPGGVGGHQHPHLPLLSPTLVFTLTAAMARAGTSLASSLLPCGTHTLPLCPHPSHVGFLQPSCTGTLHRDRAFSMGLWFTAAAHMCSGERK